MTVGSLAGNSAVATTPTYCTASDVARVLQKPAPSAHAGEGEPSLADWNATIMGIEDEIDTLTKTSWRARRQLLEFSDWNTDPDEEFWILIALEHRPVLTLSSASGDGLDVRQGGSWVDLLATATQGVNGQFWIQEDLGYLRIRRSAFQLTDKARIRISYRYGNSVVPQAIREATALLVASELASGDLISVGGRGGDVDRVGVDPRIRRWERRAYAILSNFQQWGGGY